MTRRAAWGVVALAVALSIGALLVVGSSEHLARPGIGAGIYVAAALGFVLSGVVAARRRPANRTGKLMIATGYCFYPNALAGSSDAFLFTLGSMFGAVAYAAIVALALGYPTGELRERIDRVLVLITVALATLGQLAFLLVADPEQLCNREARCPENLLDATDDEVATGLVTWGLNVALLALGVTIVVRLVQRWRRASPPLRRVMAPVLASTAFAIAVIATRVVLSDAIDEVPPAAWLLQGLSLVLIPIAFLTGLLRSRLARASLGELVTSLNAGAPLRDTLAQALDDPQLAIGYAIADGTRYVTEDGDPYVVPDDDATRAATTVEHEGAPVAVIVHDATLLEERELVEAVVGAAALALRAQRLQAESRAQYAFLKTLVETAPALVLHIGPDGRILNQNAAAVEAAGLDDEELVRGTPFWDVFIDPDERADVIERFHAAAPHFPPGEYENAFTNRRGERRVIFWRSAPVRDAGGEVTGIISGGIDVTERQLEAEARERERAFLNAIANNAPSLLCLIDDAGVVAPFAANRAFEQALEIAPDSVGGEVFWERYVAPEDADAVREIVGRVAAGEQVAAHDHVWRTASGRRIDVAWSCTPLPPMDERRLLLVSGVDVTDRKHRELELQRERDATTTVLESISSVVVVLDRDGTIRDRSADNPRAAVNRAFRQALGWREVQLVNASFLDLLVEDDDGRGAAAIATAAGGSASEEVESEWHCADGSVRAFSWSAVPVSDATGRRDVLVLVAGIEITERRQRELEAERRRRFVEAVTETIPAYLVVLEQDGRVRAGGANSSFCDAFGWTDAELAGEPFVGTVAPSTDVTARMQVAAALHGDPVGEVESRWDTRDGDSRIVAWTTRPVTSPSGERLVLVSGSDVTQRRLQEEEIRASRVRIVTAADEARRRLERDLHDGAQQRLVALSVSLRLAENRLVAGKPDEVGSMLAEARAELGLALEELRELARGIHPAVLTDRGLGPAIDALVARTPLDVTVVHADVALPAPVEAAAYFVVAEALTNVTKYAGASSASIELIVAGRQLTVLVRDDGCGGADPAAGTGLRGLADRLAALDGRLSVESPPDGGTCVRAVIPLARERE